MEKQYAIVISIRFRTVHHTIRGQPLHNFHRVLTLALSLSLLAHAE
jgi:hypothetical protein